jgi:hypothetical protein
MSRASSGRNPCASFASASTCSPDQIPRGYGETQPETKERNEEELRRNRRVISALNPKCC